MMKWKLGLNRGLGAFWPKGTLLPRSHGCGKLLSIIYGFGLQGLGKPQTLNRVQDMWKVGLLMKAQLLRRQLSTDSGNYCSRSPVLCSISPKA